MAQKRLKKQIKLISNSQLTSKSYLQARWRKLGLNFQMIHAARPRISAAADFESSSNEVTDHEERRPFYRLRRGHKFVRSEIATAEAPRPARVYHRPPHQTKGSINSVRQPSTETASWRMRTLCSILQCMPAFSLILCGSLFSEEKTLFWTSIFHTLSHVLSSEYAFY